MKKITGFLTVVLLLASVVTVYAKNSPSPEGNGSAGQSKRAHLYMYEKDSAWNVVEGGAWGKMAYDKVGDMFDFVFNGHRLNADTEYTLIYYPDPWPGNGLECLGTGVANNGSEVNIKGVVDTGNLPKQSDENFRWNIVGEYKWNVFNTYFHKVVIETQDGNGDFSGYGCYPYGAEDCTYDETISGNVTGNTITLKTEYDPGSYTVTVTGTIDADGTIHGTNPWNWSFEDGSAKPAGGAKIWLVQSGDVDCKNHKMVSWNSSEYLFEYDLINFVAE